MLTTPDQQQKLLLLHDEPALRNPSRLAQPRRSWEQLRQTSRANCTERQVPVPSIPTEVSTGFGRDTSTSE
jgi:hypothetical protein